MSILIVYGSKRGGTEGLANMVADAFREEGFTAEVAAARAAPGVEGYDTVVIGGALYEMRWHRDARRFVKRHARDLRNRATYLFSSGPLDDSATQRDIPPVKGVQALMDTIGARGHITFGGRLAPDVKGFPAAAMAKKYAGDWRDPAHVRSWVEGIAAELRAAAPRQQV
jgi:menaquinone-dependent protoporphyrinogen oxidase